ncbi:pyridoxamine 5'-phosphate oxidase family protein [Paenalcaligenes niemegkensis]|uniref:pyridoxamine 5'-phosphate oxidase family protein n=1 Tax=Paenalcaligenes niemegkensis TaxID=2895469 RepID=UPI001EE7FC9C|nr:pyridoxamine 5'-phosphate oxidase family protein [Paenalcaligenes niemegkensis]MCQ9616681.1 pyridoxamine 5'-phosphate oxidase family protein [Paenalcaligenes niemegkensis]
MNELTKAHRIADLEDLEAIYGSPSTASIKKEVSYIHPHYQKMVEAASFVVLATSGPQGLDASPRGDPAGFVHVHDEKTLLLPDRRGNNRIDSLRNILHDPRVALFFLIPGVGETLRINGRATITTDPLLLEQFSIAGKLPLSVLVVSVENVFFQCSRAVVRAGLWDSELHIKRSSLPSTGTILQTLSQAGIDGSKYDSELPERLKKTLY